MAADGENIKSIELADVQATNEIPIDYEDMSSCNLHSIKSQPTKEEKDPVSNNVIYNQYKPNGLAESNYVELLKDGKKQEEPTMKNYWLVVMIILNIGFLFLLATALVIIFLMVGDKQEFVDKVNVQGSLLTSQLNSQEREFIKLMKQLEDLKGVLILKNTEFCPKSQRNDTINFYNSSFGLSGLIRCDTRFPEGPWLVFQRRVNGSVDFFRGWHSYLRGFGDVTHEFWIGLESLHRLSEGGVPLRIDLWDSDGEHKYAEYTSFQVKSAASNYELDLSGFSGTAGDSILYGSPGGLLYGSGQPFSTRDRDNSVTSSDCATGMSGAWWYASCTYANLNGHYGMTYPKGVFWSTFSLELTRVEMKIRVPKLQASFN